MDYLSTLFKDLKISRPCVVCGKEGNFRCRKCRIFYYCSREHQEEDWAAGHKRNCRLVSVRTEEGVGSYLVAKRDFPPGSIVLVEDPLLAAPLRYTKPVCLGCYGDVGPKSMTCKCGWPMCSVRCADSPQHIPECTYTTIRRAFNEKSGKFDNSWKVHILDFKADHPLYQTIALLRALYLRDSGDPRWQKFIELETHQVARKRKALEETEGEEDNAIRSLIDFFCLRIADRVDLRRINGILLCNSFEVPRYAEDHKTRKHIEVYGNASYLEHSCVPYCAKRFPVAGGIEIRVVTYLPEGRTLNISYTDALWGTIDRQRDLCLNRYMFCKCARCIDPTELGTFISGIKCRSCPRGFLVPHPLPNSERMDEMARMDAWEYHCVGMPYPDATKDQGCGNVITYEEASSLIERLGRECSTSKTTESIQQFVRKHTDVTLHRNHFILLSARFTVIRLLKTHLLKMTGTEVSRDLPEVKLLERISEDLLEVVDVIYPGVIEIRGMLMYEVTVRYVMSLVEKYRNGVYPKEIDEYKVWRFRDASAILSIAASTASGAMMADKGRQLLIEYDKLAQHSPERKEPAEKRKTETEDQSSSSD